MRRRRVECFVFLDATTSGQPLWPPVRVAFRYDREVDLVTRCARPLIPPFQSVCRTRSVDGMTVRRVRICVRGLRDDCTRPQCHVAGRVM